ncbi:MAG: HAD-IC family P-type ATPase [Candidatus Moraniibacteriota bacterium]
MLWKKMTLPPVEEVLAELESRPSGLFPHEVKERLMRFGANEIIAAKTSWRDLVKRRFRSSFLYLLLAAAGLSFFLNERIEALLILLFIAINVGLETYQEYHSERTLHLLKRFLVSHVNVRRSGESVRIESREIVPGDILLVSAGDRLAVDVRFLESTGLMLDESVMTGETIPVRKEGIPMKKPTAEMHEAKNIGFAGTVVVSGKGIGVVLATARETALGDIATLSEETHRESAFEKGITQFSRFILRMVVLTLAAIFIANVIIRGGSAGVGELLIFSLALAVSVVPEALPVIITVALSRGSLKMAQKKVVVKRLSAIEDLGSIEVLCTDKTGTITENALAVSDVKGKRKREALVLASLASFEAPEGRGTLHDPFDLALWDALTDHERKNVVATTRIDSLPFDPERRRSSILIGSQKEGYRVVVRGAFEEVLELSSGVSPKEKKAWLTWANERGKAGERVLAVAQRALVKKHVLEESLEKELTLLGFIAFLDPLKKTASATLREAERLGVAVKILTGDSREVAGVVGHAVGLVGSIEDVMTGAELEALPHETQKLIVDERHVFARVSPRQKYLIIKLLQEKYEVGFLGEGINDAPALKLANVAIVVQGAADIAREAADVVLLQRNLGAIVDGVKEGRIIYANILKYLKITLTSNFGNFYSVALASLFLPFVPLLPIQILLLNLVSDFPMIAVATDNVDHEELEKPRNYSVGSVVLMATFLGIVSSLFDFMLFAMFYKDGPQSLQTAWFLLSVVTEVVLIFSLRTKLPFFRATRPAWPLFSLSLVALGLVFLLPYTLLGQDLFRFLKPTGSLLLTVLVLAVAYFFATEMMKRFYVSHFQEGRFKRFSIR